jgi:hypothetical protein
MITQQRTLVALAWLALANLAAAGNGSTFRQTAIKVQQTGVTQFSGPALGIAAAAPDTGGPSDSRSKDRELRVRSIMRDLARKNAAQQAQRAAALAAPTVPAVPVTPIGEDEGNTGGFPGLTNFQQRNAGTGIFTNSQFNVEPPDQGLCVGNGFVLEAINDALAVYDTQGNLLAGPTPQNQFFGLHPEVIRTTTPPVFGEFTTDPRCLHDPGTDRWFATISETDTDGFTSHIIIAVSKTNNPTGSWFIFSLDVTFDADFPADCTLLGCFGDQPLIGADSNGFFISTNSFSPFAFEGAQLYALSKAQLVAGGPLTAVHISGITSLIPGIEVALTVQPATSPPGDSGEPGTEYFVQSKPALLVEQGIIVWAIGNTGALNAKVLDPNALTLQFAMLDSESYAYPVSSEQRPGPTPFGETSVAGIADLNPDDLRMQQVSFARGQLFTALTTAATTANNPVRDAIAYFVVSVSNPGGKSLSATLASQGYLGGPANTYLMYPAIGVNADGRATMVFTLTGATRFPSVGFWNFGAPAFHITGIGTGPDDGFTGYLGDPAGARWGDYSAAAVDEHGRIWFAGEYINSSPRTSPANWATWIAHVGCSAGNCSN